MAGKSAGLRWYFDSWRSSTRRLSDKAYRIYMEILGYMWLESKDRISIPDDPAVIADLLGERVNRVAAALEEIQNPHCPLLISRPGRLVSDTLKNQREKIEVWRAKSAEGGKRSGKVRRAKGLETNHPSTTLQPPLNQTRTNPSLSLNHSSSSLREAEEGREDPAAAALVGSSLETSSRARGGGPDLPPAAAERLRCGCISAWDSARHGAVSPLEWQAFDRLHAEYKCDLLQAAIGESALHAKVHLRYVEAVCRRCKRDGSLPGPAPERPGESGWLPDSSPSSHPSDRSDPSDPSHASHPAEVSR